MQKFEDQCDPCDSICPYCGDSYQVEGEDYSESEQEITCDSCGNKYWLHQEFSVDHQTRPDCKLNGNTHKFRKLANNLSAEICSDCGKVKLLA